jgi:pimeloyl-ACP methyl ester carboxylesterase
MTVIAVNAEGSLTAPAASLDALIATLPPGAPVTIMLHGYRFSPLLPAKDPHRSIFASAPGVHDARTLSWSRRLGLNGPRIGIGFGWQADGMIWTAHAEAARAGQALASLVARLRAAGAGPVGLIGHSLGARVALAALAHLDPGDVGRMILLSAAEFRGAAMQALATPAGRMAQVLNVTSRENDLYDKAFELLMGRQSGPDGRALGAGLDAPNVVTVQIDGAHHRDGLRSLGYPTAAPVRRVCHWSAYMRPGMFPIYRAFLHRPQELTLPMLRAALPVETAPRWSRLIARPVPAFGIAAR